MKNYRPVTVPAAFRRQAEQVNGRACRLFNSGNATDLAAEVAGTGSYPKEMQEMGCTTGVCGKIHGGAE